MQISIEVKVFDITGPGPTTSPTPAPSATFPDCTFETGPCGWVVDTYDDMRWYTTNTAELLGLGYDSPKEDFKGNFIYVNALNGSQESSTIFGTPMVEKTTLEGCMNFHFSLNVSIKINFMHILITILNLCRKMVESNP